MSTNRFVRILYHYPCNDGGFAAYAAYLRFKQEPSVELKFFPHMTIKDLQIDPQVFHSQSEVYLLDYCGPRNFIPTIAPKVKRVVLIDHHKTAFELLDDLKSSNQLPPNFESFLALDKSGATLSYSYFNKEKELISDPKDKSRMEKLYSYIEDGDLWRKALPYSKEFSAGLGGREHEYSVEKNPEIFSQLEKLDVETLIEEGKEKIKLIDRVINENLQNKFKINLGGAERAAMFGQCYAIITPNPEYRSEMGNRLALLSKEAGMRAMGLLAYKMEEMEDKYQISLRSIGASEDTTVISQVYGGGGHLNASGFSISKSELESWKVNE